MEDTTASLAERMASLLSGPETIEEFERHYIPAVLEKLRGDKPEAAKALGISLKTLYNKLHRIESGSSTRYAPPEKRGLSRVGLR